MIDRFEKFSLTISQISHYWHRLAGDVMKRYGLKGPHAVYLTTLYRHPDGVTAMELSELCARDKSDVSRAAALLEKNGLLEKNVPDSGCYRAKLRLTEYGQEVARSMQAYVIAAVQSGSAGLSENQRDLFEHALELICTNLRDLTEQGLSAAPSLPRSEENVNRGCN